MNELKVLSYDLRKHVVDMIIAGKGGHIGGDKWFLKNTGRAICKN